MSEKGKPLTLGEAIGKTWLSFIGGNDEARNRGEKEREGIHTFHTDFHHDEDKQGLVPPPFKYLGPGNSLNRGEPYNEVDADAKEHDEAYNRYEVSSDIENADRDFIHKTADHFIEGIEGKGSLSNTVGAFLGGTGIGAKHLTEKLTGQLYPFSGNYRLL